MSKAEELAERAMTAPLSQLPEVEREIQEFLSSDASEDDKVYVMTAAECIAMTLRG